MDRFVTARMETWTFQGFFFFDGLRDFLCVLTGLLIKKKNPIFSLKSCMFSSDYYICGDSPCCFGADHLKWGKRIK